MVASMPMNFYALEISNQEIFENEIIESRNTSNVRGNDIVNGIPHDEAEEIVPTMDLIVI